MGKFQSIELGAGESEFGRKFYPKCLETDSDLSLLNTNCIDVITDAHKICVDDGSFDRVILCNPFPYGFVREEGLVLLREIVRILKSKGQVILIASSRNPTCQPQRIKQIANALELGTDVKIQIQVTAINLQTQYPEQKFYRFDGIETKPNTEIILQIQKS
ncbi:MAG: class I SAM-dependent methyltransferase [Candidatus Latescibacteria bacterium]|nr:class I SAM-dependent methyltransferase [Candidatus Latescibacterota bacterium]